MARPDRGDGGIARQGDAALSDGDTIFALSSGAPPAAIAIIRLSGPRAFAIAAAVAGELPPPRHAAVRPLRDGAGELLDRALCLVFPAPGSATGEDLVEFHCHGGRAVVAAVERALTARGTRLAEPGEFTRRAWLNGRIDLAQAQGLADLLSAQSEAERRLAIAAAEGAVSRAVRGWMDRLTDMAAQVEASIDFGEEGDVVAEAASLVTVLAERDALVAEMRSVLDAPPVERWRDGWRVVVAGPPNAGKSTLVNMLAARDAAIVSPVAGTTRDRIEVPVERKGVGYILIDTAGQHEATDDEIERQGIALAVAAMATADVLLWVDDQPPPVSISDALWIFARGDLPGREVAPTGALRSALRDVGSIERIWRAIESQLPKATALPAIALHRTEREVSLNVIADITASQDAVLLAEGLRSARRRLGALLGIDATDSLLNRIFSQFCLGK